MPGSTFEGDLTHHDEPKSGKGAEPIEGDLSHEAEDAGNEQPENELAALNRQNAELWRGKSVLAAHEIQGGQTVEGHVPDLNVSTGDAVIVNPGVTLKKLNHYNKRRY